MSPKFFTVVKREYVTRVRTRGFVVFTVLIPALMAGYAFAVIKISMASADVRSRIAVVNLSGKLYPTVQAVFDDKLQDGAAKYQLTEVPAGGDVDAAERDLRGQIDAGKLDAYLVLPADVLQSRKAVIHAKNTANLAERNILSQHLQDALTRANLAGMGLNPKQIADAFADFNLSWMKLGEGGEREDKGQTVVVAYLLGFLLYFSLIFFGISIMRSVTEEKMNRVSELLLSSVDSFSLMLGKIVGVAGVGLTQYLIWGACLALGTAYLSAMSGSNAILKQIPHIGPGLYVVAVVFFVLGFLVYASLYAAIGALVSSDQEAQQTAMPVTMLVVVAFVMAGLVLADPNSVTAVVLSMIPFFAPILMTMRMAVAAPPLWQILGSIALCLVTLLVLAKATAKIYRVGILMTGKRPTLPELLKWLKYA